MSPVPRVGILSPPASLRCAGSGGDQVETQMEASCDFAKERGRGKGGAAGRRVGFRERLSSRGAPSFPPPSWGRACPFLLPRNTAHGSASLGLWFRVAPRERRLLAAQWPWQTPAQPLEQHICEGDTRGDLSLRPPPPPGHAFARTG